MILIQTASGRQETHPGEVEAQAFLFEKQDTESKPKPNLVRCKNIVKIAALNVCTLKTINQQPEFTSSAVEHNIDMICVQEHRCYNGELDLKYHDTGNEWNICLGNCMEKLRQCHYTKHRNGSRASCVTITK